MKTSPIKALIAENSDKPLTSIGPKLRVANGYSVLPTANIKYIIPQAIKNVPIKFDLLALMFKPLIYNVPSFFFDALVTY